MTYEEKKQKLIKEREEVFKLLTHLCNQTLEAANTTSDIMNDLNTPDLEWMLYCSIDEDMKKLTRLTIALQYVLHPTEYEVFNALLENMEIYKEDAIKERRK